MQILFTTSGYALIPPSGLTIVSKTLQLSVVSSGNVVVSGSLGTLNATFTDNGTTLPIEYHFLQGETVTLTPSGGGALFQYIYGGEPDAFKYAQQAQAYSHLVTSGIYWGAGYTKKWNDPTSGTYQPISGGYGG